MENINAKLESGFRTAFIDSSETSGESFRPKFVSNDFRKGKKVLSSIEEGLNDCEYFCISVAFITEGGIAPLLQTLKELENKGVSGKILTTDYLTFSSPKALKKLSELKNIELRMFRVQDGPGFHTKGYIFKKDELYNIIVGSSNLTASALTTNAEWNTRIVSTVEGEFARETLIEFDYYWQQADPIEELLETYTRIFNEQQRIAKETARQSSAIDFAQIALRPNEMQVEFTNELNKLIKRGEDRALLISATGTGKTYASAFGLRDAEGKPFRRILFVVHREQIARQACKSYIRVFGNSLSVGFVSGNDKDYDKDIIFATVQTISKDYVLEHFEKDHFDAIVVDEVHRAGAESHQKIMNYFTPKLFLGMTASPERTDGYDIFELFNHNIACEIRLKEAMEGNYLCPFHYFGISDLEVNGEAINDKTDFNRLVLDSRVDHIIDKIEYYGYSGDRVRGLVFCNRKEEARTLSQKFNDRGYRTVFLSGDDSQKYREDVIKRLASKGKDDALDYIFTVDIFNEGVDIPEINQVIMLRPTQSPIVFVQQLGRGLRKYEDKEYVIILDFIGNYNNNFLIPVALSGDRSYNKDNMRKYISSGTRIIPGASSIHFDEITRQRIYASIDSANTKSLSMLKEAYKNLKFRLGCIPSILDYDRYDSIDVIKMIDYSGSYYNFLCDYEPEYDIRISEDAAKMLKLISKEFARGKRIYELVCIDAILNGYDDFVFALDACIEKRGNALRAEITKESVLRNLSNEFYEDKDKKNWPCSVIEKSGDEYKVSERFKSLIGDENFKNLLQDTIQLGIERHNKYYAEKYKDTDFKLYSKYTYADVCRILNWEKNVNAQNIGGYKYDCGTKTLPVFINYEKVEGTSTDYEDIFISNARLKAISKNNRRIDSKDVKHIYKQTSEDEDNRIYLFVRKNKDDKEAKEFYFLGEMYAEGEPTPVVRKDNVNAFAINYKLEHEVRDDIFEYIAG